MESNTILDVVKMLQQGKEVSDHILDRLTNLEQKFVSSGGEFPQLLTTKQAASFLGIKPQTLALWRTTGTSPTYVKYGNCVRYPLENLKKYLNDQTINQ